MNRPLPASVFAGALVAIIGVVALTGWAFDAMVLKSIVPGLPEMQPPTALALVFMGLGVTLLPRPVSAPWIRVVRRVLVTLALAGSALTLVHYATDIELGSAVLLVRDVAQAGARGLPPVTALGLAISAVAFLLLDVGRGGALPQILALATGILGFLNLVGYAYSLRGLSGYTAVAVHAAFGLIVLSVGILLARPERGIIRMALARTAAGVIVRRLLPVVIGAPLVIGWLVGAGRGELYGPDFATALSVFGTVVVLAGAVRWAASAVQRTDERRRRAEAARRLADQVTDRAVARTAELTNANQALSEMATRLRTLDRLNRLVSSSLEYEAVLLAIARAAADIMAAPVVSFWVADEVSGTATVRAWSDAAAGADFPFPSFAFGEGMVGTVAATRAPLHIPDVFAESRMLRAREWCTRHGLRSFYGVPVVAQDRLLAVLVLSARDPLVLDEKDTELLGSFVAQAAVALDNARLFTEAQERRRAAEAAEGRYRGLFDRNLAGIFRSTREGRLLDVNDAMLRLLGYARREDVLALRTEDLYVDAADREKAVAPLRAGERLSNAEFRWRRADGTPIDVLVNMAAIGDDSGGVVLEAIVVDVSDRERATAAEREAEALRAVAQLANAAAHEINNPLAVIVAHLDLMARKYADDPETSQRLERGRTAARRIADMIVQMGRVSRLELYEQSSNLPPILDLRKSSAPER